MSPSWREQIVIGLEPGAVQFSRLARGWRPRLVEHDRIRCEAGDGGWRQPLAILKEKLQKHAAARPTCRIVLSEQFVRYLLVPWNAELQSRQGRLQLAQAQFRAVFGDVASGWEVSLDQAGYGAPALACAVDRDLLKELAGLCGAAGGRIVSIKPHLTAAFNRSRRELHAPEFWFALIERERLWLGRFRSGGWISVSGYRLGQQPVKEVLENLEREAVLLGGEPRDAQVHLVATGLDRDSLRALREAGVNILAAQTDGFVGTGVDPDSAVRH